MFDDWTTSFQVWALGEEFKEEVTDNVLEENLPPRITDVLG